MKEKEKLYSMENLTKTAHLKSVDIEKLASQILYHKKLYYSGKSILSDKEYDLLEEKLKKYSPNHPALSTVGYEILNASKNKVPHAVPMLSLAKTYEPNELLDFVMKNSCIVVDKFDGMALSLEYDGHGQLVMASTRGNGLLGENVTEHVYHILNIPKKIVLPEYEYHSSCVVEVRGEIYFPKSQFSKYEDKFDSFRNAVPGTLGRKDVEADDCVEILNCFEFYPYDILFHDEFFVDKKPLDFLEKMNLVRKLGFSFPMSAMRVVPEHNTEDSFGLFLEDIYAQPRDYEIDGLVFRIRDENKWHLLGNTSHHPRGTLAFKKAGETAVTEILSIEKNVGRSGKISFRAQLSPVFLSGAKISYATLHNAEYIEQGNYSVGAKVEIIRSGEVIPAIVSLIEPGKEKYVLPETCFCGFKLVRRGPDLMCFEKQKCTYKDQENLVYFVSVLDIMGVSDKIVLKMRQAGLLNEPADLYKITVDDLLQIEGFAQKLSENIYQSIQNARQIPLAKFLTSLGLRRGGAVKCQEVARKFGTLEKILNISVSDLISDKGWAEKSADDFVSSLDEKKEMISHLLRYVEVLDDKSGEDLQKQKEHPYFGKNICITGALSKPREEIKLMLEKVGAKVVSSVSSKTHFLVCNEVTSSSKYKDAQKLGIPVISEAELLSVLTF